jgi:hypothetical protein
MVLPKTLRPVILAAGIAVAAIGADTASPQAQAPSAATVGSAAVTKVMIVVLENTDYSAAIRQPFLASLAARGALLTNFKGEAHPSQPNYIALISGSTHGVVSDANVDLDGPHIGDLLEAKGLQWKAYIEGYPGNCYLGATSGAYVRKHVPFLSFTDVQKDKARCARIVNASELANDVRNRAVPNFSLYVPDLNNDGHDTGVAYADKWLSGTFSPLLQDANFTKGLLFIVTFDESEHALLDGNHVSTIIVGDVVKPGTVLDADYNHYSLLRLTEDELGLGTLGQGDQRATVITGLR